MATLRGGFRGGCCGSVPYNDEFGYADYALDMKNRVLFRFPNGHTACIERLKGKDNTGFLISLMNEFGFRPEDAFATLICTYKVKLVRERLEKIKNLPHISVCPSELYEKL